MQVTTTSLSEMFGCSCLCGFYCDYCASGVSDQCCKTVIKMEDEESAWEGIRTWQGWVVGDELACV